MRNSAWFHQNAFSDERLIHTIKSFFSM